MWSYCFVKVWCGRLRGHAFPPGGKGWKTVPDRPVQVGVERSIIKIYTATASASLINCICILSATNRRHPRDAGTTSLPTPVRKKLCATIFVQEHLLLNSRMLSARNPKLFCVFSEMLHTTHERKLTCCSWSHRQWRRTIFSVSSNRFPRLGKSIKNFV